MATAREKILSDQPDKPSANDVASNNANDARPSQKQQDATSAEQQDATFMEKYSALEVCAREPIHIPGTIQPFGVLLAVDADEGSVRYVSANSEVFLGYAPSRLLEQPLAELLTPTSHDKVMTLLAELHDRRVRIDQPEKRTTTLELRVYDADNDSEGFVYFDATLHLSHTLSARTSTSHPPPWQGGLHTEIDTDTPLINPERSMLLLELEPLSPGAVSFNEVQRSLDYLRSARDVQQLLEITTETVATLCGYDRVMAYQFAPEGHGEVVAETLQQPASDGSDLESYLHLRYPASDIPEQARRLYLLNHVRFIGSNDYTPVALLTTDTTTDTATTDTATTTDNTNATNTRQDGQRVDSVDSVDNHVNTTTDGSSQAARALDLSLASLRSVSPIHLEYMRNMGTAASLVTSLIVDNELWGMVVCHHSTPRTADVHLRGLMDFLSDLVSLLIAERNYTAAYQTRLANKQQLHQFTRHLLQATDLDQAAQEHAEMLLELTNAHGVAFCFTDNTIHQLGSTPPLAVIKALHEHFYHPEYHQGQDKQQNDEHRHVTSSHRLTEDFAELEVVSNATNNHSSQGVLYVPINNTTIDGSNIDGGNIAGSNVDGSNVDGSNINGSNVDDSNINSSNIADSSAESIPKHFVMWFRDELVQTVHWGGDPNKAAEKGKRLSPRQSFSAWQETVRGQSAPWQDLELSIALELRHTIGAALLKRAEHQLSELRKRNEQVRESNMAKSEFLSRVSHELRTPLNAILGFAQVLGMRKLNDSQARGVNRILEAGKHLLNLVDEVLDISRVDAGHLHLTLEAVALWEIVVTCIDIVQPLAANKRISLECTVQDNHNPHVSADRQRLKQVIINLLANAIKYNRDDGQITVHFETQGVDRVCVRVTDTGIGIAEEKMPRLFSPFDRLDIENETNIEGTGLGLTLTKSLVEAMNGNIGAESVLGQGSTFWFTLPLAQVSQNRKPAPMSAPTVSSSRRKLVVLYIEDNTSDVEFVQYQLADYRDVQLLTSPRADKGKNLALQYQPDVIVVDQFLPDMDSDTLISQLREHKTMQQVIITGLISPGEDGSALQEAGADFVLEKPLELANLLEALQVTASD